MYVIGIDFGTKKLGFAILETDTGISSPLPILMNDNFLIDKIKSLLSEYRTNKIVFGMPSYKSTQKRLERFVYNLKKVIKNIDIEYTNEDNTSTGIKSELTSRKQKDNLDSMSAVAILNQWYSINSNSNLYKKK